MQANVGNRNRKALVALLALLAGTAMGCGKAKQPWEKVYPAKGSVSFKGKPLAGAMITLVPVDTDVPASVRPSATSKDDGTFELGTFSKNDGAPAGEYKALVLHFPVTKSKDNPSPGRNSLPDKYAKEDTTDLVIQVSQGQSDLPPLELK